MEVIKAIGILIAVFVAIVVVYSILAEYGGLIFLVMFFVAFSGGAIVSVGLLVHAIQKNDVGLGLIAFILICVCSAIAWVLGADLFGRRR